MRTISIILSLILFVRCNSPRTESRVDKFYYLFYKRDGRIDTVKYDKSYAQSATNFRHLFDGHFQYNKTEHLIRFYSNDDIAPVDGGELFYTLDNFGIIYSRAISWPNYARLQCTNDSIADLISVAINNIVSNPNLHCYNCSHYEKGITGDSLPRPVRED
jgi:hypothetical protein